MGGISGVDTRYLVKLLETEGLYQPYCRFITVTKWA